jgi:5-methylcytosine-specific restriction endonuclease McrA
MPRRLHDWEAVQVYYDEGHGFVECSRRFGFTHTAWTKAISRGTLRVKSTRFADRRRKYDWTEVQGYYDDGHSYRRSKAKFGFCAASWTNAVRRGDLKPRSFGMPIAELLSNPKRSRKHVKMRLTKAGLLPTDCQSCGLSDWRDEPLSMHLDHINGIKDDNRLENLRILCPNCHSQTPTYGGRNLKRPGLQGPAPGA